MRAHPSNLPPHADLARGAFFIGSAGGFASRAAELSSMRRAAGWRREDSAAACVGARCAAAPPRLTGCAWHWPRGCPAACGARGGVCLPPLGRCDCPRGRYGASCEVPVQPALARPAEHHGWCVYNDSRPFFCDRPLCVHSAAEAPLGVRCVGEPLERCPRRCSARGECRGGACRCWPGHRGAACEASAAWHCLADCLGRGACERGFCVCRPPYYGVDCSLSPPASPATQPVGHLGTISFPPPSSTATASSPASSSTSASPPPPDEAEGSACLRPCVYVYELPARMTVLALKAEPEWGFYAHGPADYRAFIAVHASLLRSRHRTADPTAADLFYVPAWDFHGSWGNPEVTWRAQQYVRTLLPYWNRSGGADHVWANTRDAAGCSTPWGSVWEETHASIVLSNWGGVTGLAGVPTERCFDARRDVVIPGVLRAEIAARSPFLPFYREAPHAAAAAAAAAAAPHVWRRRDTLLFFHGALCWQTYDHVRSLAELARKCARRHGFIDDYAFGARHQLYVRFRNEPGFLLRATDVLPAPPPADLSELMLRSTFCFCPSGTGWGMRVYHAAALGCIPVILQRDAAKRYPPVLQAFEGELLDWSSFAVRLEPDELPRLPAILRAIASNGSALAAKRRALGEVWTRLLWRVALPPDVAHALRRAPDAFDSLMQIFGLRLQAGDVRSSVPYTRSKRER
ncbi:hypothetical protein AB1Y20_022344 [Prymnesium parvum]|uniref:EGF-like domain-containing protein n=1 Tax=Prymnesium parvum TaxID=97485 RepID=A0AB34JIN7_PRYPA